MYIKLEYYLLSTLISNRMPQNHGCIIAKCKTLCLALSHEVLIPSIPAAVRLPNLRLFKCSIPLIQRMMEWRIVMVLRLIYLLPTLQAPLPFHLTHLVLLVTLTSWDLEHSDSERHPPLHLSHLQRHSVRLESGEVGTELRNTLGDGKMQESGNAEGAGKRKCGRS